MPSMLSTRRGIVLTGALLATGFLQSFTAGADPSPIEPIQRLNQGLVSVMKAGAAQTPFNQRFDMLAPIIDRTFSLDTILQESVGLMWPELPSDQQAALEQAFRRYTVASYVNSFDNYTGQHFEVLPNTKTLANSQQVVQTRIIPGSGGSGHELDYVMREISGTWRVVDVLADGSISRVAVQRSDFRRLLSRGGAQALADSLKNKTADLSEGSG